MIDQLIVVSVVSVLLLVVAAAFRVHKHRVVPAEHIGAADNVDTLAGWPPQATRVLSVPERNAYDLLYRALPGYMVFGQLPISRFIKVPTRYSYAQWLRRVGNHCVDLVVADPLSRVVAVIEIRSHHPADKSLRRHERVSRVLETVGIPMYEWTEGELPNLAQVRALFKVAEPEPAKQAAPVHAHPVPLALPPVDPAKVAFYIANEALSKPLVGASLAEQHEDEVESASMVAAAMLEGVPSRDTPPTTWYDEFDNHLPSALVTDDTTAAAEEGGDPHSPLLLQYNPQ